MIHRAKKKSDGEWVKGTYVDDCLTPYIITREQWNKSTTPFPPKGNIEPVTVNATRVLAATVGRCSDISDINNVMVFEGDIVRFCGMTGVIVCEGGAFGIGCSNTIDYDVLEKEIPYANFANNPYFCYCDNFISLWELIWNYGHTDNPNECDVIEVIGNKYDNSELL